MVNHTIEKKYDDHQHHRHRFLYRSKESRSIILFYEYLSYRMEMMTTTLYILSDNFFLDHPLLQNFLVYGKSPLANTKNFVCPCPYFAHTMQWKRILKRRYFDKIRIDKPFNILYDIFSEIVVVLHWCY